MPIGVSLNVHPGIASQRFADDIEGAAYFFITEALTNVLKHSGSESVEVTVGVDRPHGLREPLIQQRDRVGIALPGGQ